LVRYCPQCSACLPQTTIWCHSVRSCLPLLVIHTSLVARGNRQHALPLGVNRTSGFLPRLPTRNTLFTEGITESSFTVGCSHTSQGESARGEPAEGSSSTSISVGNT